MIRFYVIPRILVGNTTGPKYFTFGKAPPNQNIGITCVWTSIRYGTIPASIVCADISDADHISLIANPDVYYFSTGLDAPITQTQLSILSTFLENVFIPANWINANDTTRTVLRTIIAMFQMMQRLTTLTGNNPLDLGLALNTQWRNVPTQYQDFIVQTYNDLGYDASVIQSNWTMRTLLKNAADQWGSREINLGLLGLL